METQAPTTSSPPQMNRVQIQQQMFSGPIPPPEILAQYDKLQAGLAERIVRMAEIQGEHRREQESKALTAQIAQIERRDHEAKRGQIFAFIIAISAIALGAFASIMGATVTGSIIGGLGLGGIITTFVYGRKREHK